MHVHLYADMCSLLRGEAARKLLCPTPLRVLTLAVATRRRRPCDLQGSFRWPATTSVAAKEGKLGFRLLVCNRIPGMMVTT